MSRILYSRATCATGQQLRDILGIKGSMEAPTTKEDVLIRWGSSKRIKKIPGRTINKRNAVERAADKLLSLSIMQDAHVPVPKVYVGNDALNASKSEVLLGRRVNHTQGRDIILCLQREDVKRALALPNDERPAFFTSYIPTSREFRVHVFEKEVLKISEKILTDEDKFQVSWIRNFENGYTFRNVRDIGDTVLNNISQAAIAAIEALGLDFGAVDIVLSDDGFWYVLEVNTGPSLGDNSLEVYVTKFAEILGVQPNWPDLEDPDEAELEELAR